MVKNISRRELSFSLMASPILISSCANLSNSKNWPKWADGLLAKLEAMAKDLQSKLAPWQGSKLEFYPEDFGYIAGQKLSTLAIQKAIDSAHLAGGGTIRLKSGDYISGTLVLKDNVRLLIDRSARLLGSLDLKDWPEKIAQRRTVQDTNMGMNQSLIFAEGCTNISIAGEGEIDGRGKSFKGEETIHGTPGRPFIIRIIDCKKVHIDKITLLDSPCWMQNYLNCDDLLIENIKVDNQANWNNDGCDIDGCRNVIVRNCYISSGDDALCFKGASQRPTENILVENCKLYTSCNAIKLGTDSQSQFKNVLVRYMEIGGVSENMRRIKPIGADSGISWEIVDGGNAENIYCHNINIVRARSPFFMRIDNRGRVQPNESKPPIGTLKRIVFDKITGTENGPRGSYFNGIPKGLIEDVAMRDIQIEQITSIKPVLVDDQIPELYNKYPDAHMIDGFGDAPAYGLWARHIKNLTLVNYKIIPQGKERRPEFVIKNNVQGIFIS